MSDGLASLPGDLARHRVLTTAEAAAFCGFGIDHWRTLAKLGKVPRPIRISDRKLGWRASELMDFLASRPAVA